MIVLDKQLCCSGDIMERVDLLARHSEMLGGITRTYLTAAHTAAAAQIASWMSAAGMSVHRDAAGNVIGRYEGSDPTQPAVVTGSHFDSVRNGGKYDGNIGILLPLSCIEHWHRRGQRFTFPIVVIAFADAEGARFKTAQLGSRAVAGIFNSQVLDNLDEQGMSLREAMLKAGFDPQHMSNAAWSPLAIRAFLEIHIEQGPLLLEKNMSVGVVTAISGMTRFMVGLDGLFGHVGTVPMQLRRDAAMAAAEIGLMIERRCGGRPGLVGTVDILEIPNGAAGVVPAAARFSIDIRAEHDEVRIAAVNDVLYEIGEITRKRNIKGILRKTYETSSVPCHAGLQRRLAMAVERAGLPLQYLPSGAEHDAMVMASIADVAMLFVRCGNDGISHHPHEIMSTADATAAAKVFMHFIEGFD